MTAALRFGLEEERLSGAGICKNSNCLPHPHLHIDTQSTRLALTEGSGTQSRHLWTVPYVWTFLIPECIKSRYGSFTNIKIKLRFHIIFLQIN